MKNAVGTFLVSAPEQPCILARFTSFFGELGLHIVDSSSFTERHAADEPRFYLRLAVDLSALRAPRAAAKLGRDADRTALERSFGELARALRSTWSVSYSDERARIAILATKDGACLYDLLLRYRAGELPCDIAFVASNHAVLEDAARSFGIAYHHLPVVPDRKHEQEGRLLSLLREHDVSLVVLARYMQILSSDFLAEAPPVINIHHGFLPAFQGARPYHQAHGRGVKIIGATAHYATKDLDEGPIIEQDVVRVSHAMGPDDLVRVGRDVERVVLARAVRAHLERRIIVEGRRTLVL